MEGETNRSRGPYWAPGSPSSQGPGTRLQIHHLHHPDRGLPDQLLSPEPVGANPPEVWQNERGGPERQGSREPVGLWQWTRGGGEGHGNLQGQRGPGQRTGRDPGKQESRGPVGPQKSG